jgi:hypothetical protein
MPNIYQTFNKFLETQNIGTILTELTALFVSWQSWKKYKDSKARKKAQFNRAIEGKKELKCLLEEVEELFTERDVIVSIAEVSNGGGIPQMDKPLYIRALESTDEEAIKFWGNKTLVTHSIMEALQESFLSGSSSILTKEIDRVDVEAWSKVKKINKVFYFYIGMEENKRVLYLAVNSHELEDLSDDEILICKTLSIDVKNRINKERKFYQTKIK